MAKLTVVVSDELHRQVRLRAVRDGETVASVVRGFLLRYVSAPHVSTSAVALLSPEEPVDSQPLVPSRSVSARALDERERRDSQAGDPGLGAKRTESRSAEPPGRDSASRSSRCPMNPPAGTRCKTCGKVHS